MAGCVAAGHAAVLLLVCVHVQVLMSELGAAGFNTEWAHWPNGNSGS